MPVVLIVDDDLFILELAEMLIQEFGYETLSASDVDEAAALLRSSQRVDALFTDINLKNAVLGGCELASTAVGLRPDLRVLYATGNIITDKMRSLFVDGALLLTKPYTQSQLQTSLEDLIRA